MLTKPLDEITIADLQQLIDESVQEGKTVEYKEAMYRVDPMTKGERQSDDDEQKKTKKADRDRQIIEFLKDISSFANTIGGHLIVGMKETNGVPTAICGVEIEDPDQKKRQLDEFLQHWLEPRIASTTTFIAIEPGKFVFIIHILQSRMAPHRVTYQDCGDFFARSSGRAYRMDTSELRTAFTLSESIFDRIKSFRRDRVRQIMHGEAPIPLPQAAKMILHLVPVESYTASVSLGIHQLERLGVNVLPPGRWSVHSHFNMDGHVLYGGGHLSESQPLSEECVYSQMFRNGTLEVVRNGIVYDPQDEKEKRSFLRMQTIEPDLIEAFPRYLQFFKQAGISPPIWCFLTLTDVKGAYIHCQRDHSWFPPIDRSDLFIPEIVIDDLNVGPDELLRPLFDMIWNSAGRRRSLNFNEQGQFVG